MTTMAKKLGRPKATLTLTEEERSTLERYERGRTVSQALALRARIVLHASKGWDNQRVATELSMTRQTAGKWRNRFLRHRLEGLTDVTVRDRKPEAGQDLFTLAAAARQV